MTILDVNREKISRKSSTLTLRCHQIAPTSALGLTRVLAPRGPRRANWTFGAGWEGELVACGQFGHVVGNGRECVVTAL